MTARTPEQSSKIAQICLDMMSRPREARSILAARTILVLGTASEPAGRLLADMEPELRDLCAEYVDLARHMVQEPSVLRMLEGVAADAGVPVGAGLPN